MDQWNGTFHTADVTSMANSELARNISAKATVLLKNNGILPLKPGKKVVLIGADANIPFVHGGGSGSVEPVYTVSPFSAIKQRNGGTIPKSGPGGGGPAVRARAPPTAPRLPGVPLTDRVCLSDACEVHRPGQGHGLLQHWTRSLQRSPCSRGGMLHCLWRPGRIRLLHLDWKDLLVP